MSQANAENSTVLPVTRRQVEAQITALIDLLDTLDADPDAEPSLGFSNGGYRPEDQMQEGYDFAMNANRGDDCEEEDEREPHEDGEASLGWTSTFNQTSPGWLANHLGTVDLEDGAGPVRKKRPASKTGNRVLVGVEVFR